MDYKFFLIRLPFIILHPSKAWGKIASETRPVKDIRNSFLFPLIIMVAIFVFFGSLLFTNSHLSFLYSVFVGIKLFVLLFLVVYVSAIIHKEITYALDLGRDFAVSFKIIVYSLSPLFICLMISHLFESLIFVNILALYGLYIFWIGSERILNPPEHKKMPMLIATTLTVIALYIGFSWILTQIMDRIFYAFFA
jgi:hypothetical protein